MHPVTDEGTFPMPGTLALGDLGLMVGKDVVDAATVDVDGLAEESCSHGAALDVPSGAALAPGALPSNGSIFGHPRLPESEVGNRLLLVFVAGDTLTRTLSLEIDMSELSVVGKRGDAEIDRSILAWYACPRSMSVPIIAIIRAICSGSVAAGYDSAGRRRRVLASSKKASLKGRV